ncbi:histidine phosphatase family protein [Maledivibacter halophilus]|uniref:2,3-bisphosphoglycerate-dependent phosphoglycerate mutase n=1 Tax=Maledivibacter halophilus TaxID=36842 RepID=A0A1T5KR73_9FIRM|nr:histidine phosphatase family protein [Maledivibacter halophilus]SKC66274.1 2,3-bisphosphoglycerate-dependent phosphoglycerate mutase [Maledivibacter halophilus]
MTRIYFVRHSKPDFSIKDDLNRPLCEEGIRACKKITEYLSDKRIHKVYSSPFKRAVDTIKDFADRFEFEIEKVEDLRERKVADIWIEDFNEFAKKQWEDFNYKLSNGENLNEVQTRNINVIHKILKSNADKNIVIGTHGTALSTIINYYDKSFDYSVFSRIKNLMLFIVFIDFEGLNAINIQEVIIK